jgi:hypothetical protein
VEAYQQALGRAEALEMRPLVGHCRFGLGQLSLTAGDRSTACEHLAAAAAIYRQMEMAHWVRLVETTRSELS